MKQRLRIWLLCVCAVAAIAVVRLPECSAATRSLAQPDSGMTLDTAELTLELTEDDPAPVAYLCIQAPNDYFFVIWSSSDSKVATVDGTGKVTGRAEGSAVITAYTERGEKATDRKSVV